MSNCAVSISEINWYAVYVRYQSEYKVARILREKVGLDARVPSLKMWRRKNGKSVNISRPLLDTYVFIRADIRSINWTMFYSINGIIGLVRLAGAPVPVPERQIESLEALGSSSRMVHVMEYKRFSPDEMVEVTSGPLEGATGAFIRSNRQTGMFVVSLDLFQRSLVTEVDARCVRPA